LTGDAESFTRPGHLPDGRLNDYYCDRSERRLGKMSVPANPQRQPALFLPHGGGPCFFMDWTWGPPDTWHATQRFLEGLSATLPDPPKALLVVSGHREEPKFTASTAAAPKLIFDYSGFPESTYRLTWPAPGDPSLAARVALLLGEAGLPAALDPTRGYDHGVFVPLKVAFPAA
jgi:aromatic ring-opening dioxygenase catalytic subunit (LigB family)